MMVRNTHSHPSNSRYSPQELYLRGRSEDRALGPGYSNCFYKDQLGFSYVKSIFGGFFWGVGGQWNLWKEVET